MIHPIEKVSEQVNRKCPIRIRFYNFQPYTSHLRYPISSNSQLPKFRNFTSLLHLAFLVTWQFCLPCYEHRTLLISRWSLINALYAVRSAFSATAGLLLGQLSSAKSLLYYRHRNISPMNVGRGTQESLANAKVSARQPCWSKTDFDVKLALTICAI